MAQVSGAVDLSKLTQASPQSVEGAYVTEVTEATFDATVRSSVQYPVVLEFYSSNAPESATMGETLAGLANAAGGAWLLGRMNVDTSPQIVAALQIRAVPMVVGVLGGQLVPLWQGSMPRQDAEKVIGELLKMAAGNGILGRAEPRVEAAPPPGPAEDPQYSDAYDAMGRGDYAAAREAFEKLLSANPADALAKTGKAQAGLLDRAQVLDAAQVLAKAGTPQATIDDIMAAADVEVAGGQAAQGFARLIAAIGQTTGEDKERLRARLVELFDTQDPADKVVLTARRNLATALF